jgi:hypothetical protein
MKHLLLLSVSITTATSSLTPAFVSAKTAEKVPPQTSLTNPLISLEQSDADRQREAERILKEAERIRRENSNNGSKPGSGDLEKRTNSAVDRLRNNFGNEQKLRESQQEVERLRREGIERSRRDESSREREERFRRERIDREQQNYQNSPTIIPVPIPYSPPFGTSEFDNSEASPPPTTVIERSPNLPFNSPQLVPNRPFGQSDQEFNPKRPDLGTASVSLGFANGSINPAIGYRFGNSPIGIEIGAVFNQNTLILPPGQLNDFSVPDSLRQQFPTGFDNIGRRNSTPQIGADLIGNFKVAPNVSLYGGVGLYFQSQVTFTRSNITTDLFQATNTDISVAVSGGADVRVSDSLRIGAGYHSLRGVTAKVGIDF